MQDEKVRIERGVSLATKSKEQNKNKKKMTNKRSKASDIKSGTKKNKSTRNSMKKNVEKKISDPVSARRAYELKLLILIAFTVFSILSVHTLAMGKVGLLLSGLFFGLFGKMGYFVPYFIAIIIFMSINPNFKSIKVRYIIAFILIFFSLLIILSLENMDTLIEILKFNKISSMSFKGWSFAYKEGLQIKGGGTIGFICSYAFVQIFGESGIFIVIATLIGVGIMLVMRVSFKAMLEKKRNIKNKMSRVEIPLPKKKEPKRKINKNVKNQIKNIKKSTKDESKDNSVMIISTHDSGNYKVRERLKSKVRDFQVYDSDDEFPDEGNVLSQKLKDATLYTGVLNDKLQEIDMSENTCVFAKGDMIDDENDVIINSYDINNDVAIDDNVVFKDDENVKDVKEFSLRAAPNNTVSSNAGVDSSEKVASIASAIRKTKNSKSNKNLDNINSSDEKSNNVNYIDENYSTKKEENKATKNKKNSSSKKSKAYKMPSIRLLNKVVNSKTESKSDIRKKVQKLETTLMTFGVEAKVVEISQGPTITMFELELKPGIKVSKITGLTDDIALALAARRVRVIAPIPGKSAVGVEIPNENKSLVGLKDVINTDEFINAKSKLTCGLGKDIAGKPVCMNLAKMPHLLIAGATGSGKSVCVNTIISSILFNAKPNEVKFLMIDPKVVELNVYNGIPHLILPVVTDPKKAAIALNWAVAEMTRRYQLFADSGTRDVDGYNQKLQSMFDYNNEELDEFLLSNENNAQKSFDKRSDENKNENEVKPEILPKIVVIIDELADLMMVSPDQVEDAICRLAQMARAAGIHLIVATQRPSVDVITGIIKANIPSRIAFSVSSQTDSRTILDRTGAEKLLGMGDMLYYPTGFSEPQRIQGAFISNDEVAKLTQVVSSQVDEPDYEEDILENESFFFEKDKNADEYLQDAIELVVQAGQASASMLQRKFRIGYNRAARLVEDMEERGIVGPTKGSKPRDVLISVEELNELKD